MTSHGQKTRRFLKQAATLCFLPLIAGLAACDGGGGQATPIQQGPLVPMALGTDIRTQALTAPRIAPRLKSRFARLGKAHMENLPNLRELSREEQRRWRHGRHQDGDYRRRDAGDDRDGLNMYGRSVRDAIRRDCRIEAGLEDREADSRPGAVTVVDNRRTIQGPRCPVDFVTTVKSTTHTRAYDPSTGGTTATMKMDETAILRIQNPELISQVIIAASESTTSVESRSENAVFQKVGDRTILKSGAAYHLVSMKGSASMPDGRKIPKTMRAEVVERAGQKDVNLLGTVRFVEGDIVFAIIRRADKTEYILNGEFYSRAEFVRDFGIDVDALDILN